MLTIDVARVGSYAMLPNSTMTPRSLIPLEGDVSENEELMKMSGLMIYVGQAGQQCTELFWCHMFS